MVETLKERPVAPARDKRESLMPTSEYLEYDDAFYAGNFDPYRELLFEELDDEQVKTPPSLVKRLFHTLF